MRVEFETDQARDETAGGSELIALDELLEKLFEIDPRQGRIVELRYFAGLSMDETARALDISRATVAREWRMARAWLERQLRDDGPSE
jgi:RNA polymerase sigma factor (sigma-70 family)